MPLIPEGYLTSDKFFDLSIINAQGTTGSYLFTQPITVTVLLDPVDLLLAGGIESNVVIQHYDEGESRWIPLSTTVDFRRSIASTTVDSLSTFALTIRETEPTPVVSLAVTPFPTPTSTVIPTATPVPTPTVTLVSTPSPTRTQVPSPTPIITVMTATPAPTPTPMPTPLPPIPPTRTPTPLPTAMPTSTPGPGTLWAWGENDYGQIGDKTMSDKNTPSQESTGATNWSFIAVGRDHTVALKWDGTLWAWGRNWAGQFGDGSRSSKTTPSQESTGATNWSAIATGYERTVALKSDGTLWAWGENDYGQLGDGTIVDKFTPTQESTGATDWSAIATGFNHTVALKSDGTLWAWGRNRFGQIGDGSRVTETIPTQESTWATNWSAIASGGYHTVALKSDGTLWAWGWNTNGQLGDGTKSEKTTPTQESTGATNWSAIASGGYHTVALKSDGTVWAWGENSFGQLGDGTIADKTIPTQESTKATNWAVIAAGWYHTVALK